MTNITARTIASMRSADLANQHLAGRRAQAARRAVEMLIADQTARGATHHPATRSQAAMLLDAVPLAPADDDTPADRQDYTIVVIAVASLALAVLAVVLT